MRGPMRSTRKPAGVCSSAEAMLKAVIASADLGVADAERLLHLAEDGRQQHDVDVAREVRDGDQGDHLGIAAPPGLCGRQGERFTRRRH